jgi:hypothetical protein
MARRPRTVHPDLVDGRALFVLALDLLDSHVLALAELEDVLLAVDDLDGAVCLELRNIAGMEPAALLQNLRLRACAGVSLDECLAASVRHAHSVPRHERQHCARTVLSSIL